MKINVCGVAYQVTQMETVDNEPTCLGLCIYDKTQIQIKENMSGERKKQVLIHELTHAMLHEAGYKEHDESLVENLSIVINQVLQENDLKAILNKLE